MEILSLVASITSAIMAIMAIALSIMFYRWSDRLSREMGEILVEIRAFVSDISQNQYSVVMESVKEALKVASQRPDLLGEKSVTGVVNDVADEVFRRMQKRRVKATWSRRPDPDELEKALAEIEQWAKSQQPKST